MAHEVFKNSIEDLCRKNCERVLIIIYSLCKNVLRVCRKEASLLTGPSPFCTANQTGWENDVCLWFFPSRCSQSNKSWHYDMKWTTVVNHQVAHHLPGTTNPINLDTIIWSGWQCESQGGTPPTRYNSHPSPSSVGSAQIDSDPPTLGAWSEVTGQE